MPYLGPFGVWDWSSLTSAVEWGVLRWEPRSKQFLLRLGEQLHAGDGAEADEGPLLLGQRQGIQQVVKIVPVVRVQVGVQPQAAECRRSVPRGCLHPVDVLR